MPKKSSSLKNPYVAAKEFAAEYDHLLRADDPRFRGAVSVLLEDGAYFFFPDAFYTKFCLQRGDVSMFGVPQASDLDAFTYWVIFTEHYGFHVHDQSDVRMIAKVTSSFMESPRNIPLLNQAALQNLKKWNAKRRRKHNVAV